MTSTPLHLVIGNKNYSSWSLRPWLAMAHFELPFEETVVPLGEPGFKEAIEQHSPAGLAPILHHGDITVWDSLAILEYLADAFFDLPFWPGDPHAKAVARAVSAEMHAGFGPLRAEMPMNIRAKVDGVEPSEATAKNIARVTHLWTACRAQFGSGGEFLFGAFSIADAMYAPVVTRLETYQVAVDKNVRAYMDAVQTLPAMQRWTADAKAEPWAIQKTDGMYASIRIDQTA